MIYDDQFNDDSGDWLDPAYDGNSIADGELVVDDIAGRSNRLLGDSLLAVMPLHEVQATMEFRAENLTEVGIYCRLDSSYAAYYRVAFGIGGTRVFVARTEFDVPAELFKSPTPALDPNQSGTLAFACFDEADGFHLDAFLDGELIAQAVDTEEPPNGGIVRVAWANPTKAQMDGPYVFRMSSFLLEGRT